MGVNKKSKSEVYINPGVYSQEKKNFFILTTKY